jgi:hypothetical protein
MAGVTSIIIEEIGIKSELGKQSNSKRTDPSTVLAKARESTQHQ